MLPYDIVTWIPYSGTTGNTWVDLDGTGYAMHRRADYYDRNFSYNARTFSPKHETNLLPETCHLCIWQVWTNLCTRVLVAHVQYISHTIVLNNLFARLQTRTSSTILRGSGSTKSKHSSGVARYKEHRTREGVIVCHRVFIWYPQNITKPYPAWLRRRSLTARKASDAANC